MIRKHFLFEAKVVFFTLIILLIVVIVGLLAHRSMSEMVFSIREETRPDMKLTILKQIQAELSDAESSVKSYSITREPDYLEPFYQAASSIDGEVNHLYKLSNNQPAQQQVIDSLKFLIEQKFTLLQSILGLQEDNRVEEALGKISDQLQKAEKEEMFANYTKPSELPKEPYHVSEEKTTVKKSNIISRLFSRKQKKKEIPEDTLVEPVKPASLEVMETPVKDTSSPAVVQTSKIKKEITKIRKQEVVYTNDMMSKQLMLTQKDKQVMDKIRSYVLQLEELERKEMAAKAERAQILFNDASRMIAAFCIVMSILLFVVGYQMVSYAKKTSRYNDALKKAKAQAEHLAKIKESFLSTMSHEIRTPMNAIYGFTEQLLETPLRREQLEHVEIIKKSADHLICIINDILDFSKLEAGKLELTNTGFSTRETIEDIICMMRPYAEGKNISLVHMVDSSIPDVLIGDPVRLKQILINLISNAIKFTNEGEVKVNCFPVLKNDKTVRLQISVKDTGIGIPANKIHRIFNEFEQIESTVRQGGTGLGLTITKRLVTLQHGNIQVSSKEGKGTVVTVSIPYSIGTSEDKAISDNYHFKGSSVLGDITVLVADDEAYNRLLLSTILRKWGVIHKEVQNGQEAVNELEKNKYDLVLMDVQMPVMNGIQATQYIRTHDMKSNNRNVPVMAVIASVSEDVVRQCKEVGMNDILHKPFKEKELYDKVLLLLGDTIEREKPEELMMEEEPEENSKGYNLEEIFKMSNGNNEFVKEMIRLFIKATSEGSVEIRNAVKNNSWEHVMYQAHKISAPCKHIEAEYLYQLLKAIEDRARTEQSTLRLDGLLLQMEDETNKIIHSLEAELTKIH